MLLEARRDLDALSPPPRRDIAATTNRLVDLYIAWGQARQGRSLPGAARILTLEQDSMSEFPRVRPKSREAWRAWLEKHHASSTGVWLVYAKKHAGIPSLTYNDAVEEALCFGWIDSKINPIDDVFYMQVFTPRKSNSLWSALNKARVKRLLAAGLMSPAGLVVVKAAKDSGTVERAGTTSRN